jgi:metallo-beta-lactamase family protein
VKLTFLGAAHEVTGSSTMLSACGKNILIDCGLEQGPDIYENCDCPVNPADIDCILLTHAHIDHSGKIPYLVANGYSGPIYSTEATRRLCSIMLLDSAYIQGLEAEWRNRKAARAGDPPYTPLYTIADVEKTMPLFSTCGYGEQVKIADGIWARFIDAGHLLGSASIELTITEGGKTIVLLFSGDLGNVDRPLLRNPVKPRFADYVVIEGTYGDRSHGERPDYVGQLTEIIQSTLDRGGNVVIPAFAVGRTQEILYLLRIIKEQQLIKGHGDFPVWLDSPLAIEATHIYTDDMTEYYDAETLALVEAGINPISFPGLRLSVTSDESKLINEDKTPKIIISASGMCEAGRIRHHLKHNLWRQESTVLFVGYQSEGSLGRILQDGAKTVKLFGEKIAVKARIETLRGISAHADVGILLDWLGSLSPAPQRVFVNHCSDDVCDVFAQTISDRLGYRTLAPYNGAEYDLAADRIVVPGNMVKIKKETATARNQAAFERLLLAGRRLLEVIEKNRGGANKDLAKFTAQINALSDKWDK